MKPSRVLALWCVPLLLTACRETAERPAGADARAAVALPPEAYDAVKAEMRAMLGAVQGLLAAAPGRDTTAMLAAAAAAGTPAAADTALEQLLPEAWMTLAMTVHAGFDSLAVAIRGGARADTVAGRLGRVMTGCVGCHSQFRLVAAEEE